MRLVYLDCETSGLNLECHEIWEVAVIIRDTPNNDLDNPEGVDVEKRWFLPMFNFSQADPFALDIGKFWERYVWPDPQQYTKDFMSEWCRMFCQLTRGATIVGACVDFDVYRLDRLLKRYEYRMFHNYHLVDVENLVAGMYRIPPPWKSDDLADRLGYTRDKDNRHTALGDAREARDWYDRIMAESNPRSDSSLQG